eukprot:TRINITY_DN14455_c0_g1_i1.p1 TRINITY_DN14455_c0_g1~~TRINITY_DN14455_c0_g1_i1.p1  ORF type:complete len:689 (+),score=151.03 TRINITY_DN14455_c0_g1_i1:166-2067(+)
MALSGFRDTQKLADLFEAVDVDKSGTLEFGEFLMLMFLVEPLDKVFRGPSLDHVAAAWKILETQFSKHDLDDNLLLGKAELQKLLQTTVGESFASSADVAEAYQERKELKFSEFLQLLYRILMPHGRYREKSVTSRMSQIAKSHPKEATTAPTPSGVTNTEVWAQLERAFVAMEADFKGYDKAGSGYIDLAQLTQLPQGRLEADVVDILSRLQHYFSVVDLDESNTLTFDEYLYLAFLLAKDGAYADVVEHAKDASIVKGTLLALHQAFRRHDVDSSLRLDRTETQQMLIDMLGSVPPRASEIFGRLMTSPQKPTIDFVRCMRLLYELVRGDAGLFTAKMPEKPRQPRTPISVHTHSGKPVHKVPRVEVLKVSDVEKQEQIGAGGFGRVYRAKFLGHIVAAKFFTESDAQIDKEAADEVHVMRLFDHNHLLFLIGAQLRPPPVCIVTEYCENGSLFDCIHKKRMHLQPSLIWRIARETAAGLLKLHTHSPSIIHRDVKSLNILLDANMLVKVADFGLSKEATAEMEMKVGTPQWMAPEVLTTDKYGISCDVYSYAIVLWEMTHRQIPYGSMNQDAMVKGVLKGMRPKISTKCPVGIAKLMIKCWSEKPDARPSFAQVIRELDEIKVEMEQDDM